MSGQCAGNPRLPLCYHILLVCLCKLGVVPPGPTGLAIKTRALTNPLALCETAGQSGRYPRLTILGL